MPRRVIAEDIKHGCTRGQVNLKSEISGATFTGNEAKFKIEQLSERARPEFEPIS